MHPIKTKAFRQKSLPKLLTPHSYLLTLIAASLLLSGCSDKEKPKSLTEGGMKCGAGKCGSSMANGSALLVKKKMNMLDQMRQDDTRRDCVLKAKTTKVLYDCVRDPETGRMTLKCGAANPFKKAKKVPQKVSAAAMKCEAGKCSAGN